MDKPTITLCMIVKDESHVIERCLKSIAPFVDRYDITDTGSTDGTPEKIKAIMDELNVPGEVHLSDWKGFGDHGGKKGSRTESFENAAKSGADYAWVIDADDEIVGEPDISNIELDSYALLIHRGEYSWWRNQIFKLSSGWRYVGVLHEYAECTGVSDPKIGKLKGEYHIEARTEGARNVGIDPKEKYSRDAAELEKALVDDPKNGRYQFYLGQSYFDSQQWEKSAEAYQKRAEMGGWPEECYFSLLRVAMCYALMGKPFEQIQDKFLIAHAARPTRAEALYHLARINRLNGRPAIGYIYAKNAIEIPYPQEDILFVQEDVYQWAVLDEIGATAYYAGKPHVGYSACKKLLEENIVPEGEAKERVTKNYSEYERVLSSIHADEFKNNIDYELEKIKKQKENMEDKLEKKKQRGVKKSTKTPSPKGKKKTAKSR
jgi:tetratricopeptide (TPR) repeat protein